MVQSLHQRVKNLGNGTKKCDVCKFRTLTQNRQTNSSAGRIYSCYRCLKDMKNQSDNYQSELRKKNGTGVQNASDMRSTTVMRMKATIFHSYQLALLFQVAEKPT